MGHNVPNEKLLEYLNKRKSMVLFIDTAVQAFESLQKDLSFLYGKVMWNMGVRLGKFEAEKYLKEVGFENIDNMLEDLQEYLTLIGVCDEVTFEKERDLIVIRMRGLVPGAYVKSKKPVDVFMAGFLKGWFDSIVGKSDVKEVRCQAEGYEFCEFHVRVRKHGGS